MASLPSFIPRTTARLNPYIRLYSPGPEQDPDAVTLSSIKNMSRIATITNLHVKMDRDTGVWRELDWSSGGIAAEIYPKLPKYSGTISKMTLYKKPVNSVPGTGTVDNIMSLFGFDDYNLGFDIIAQNRALLIAMELPVKNASGDLVDDSAVILALSGVWFENCPWQFRANDTGDLTLEQEVNFSFRKVIATSL